MKLPAALVAALLIAISFSTSTLEAETASAASGGPRTALGAHGKPLFGAYVLVGPHTGADRGQAVANAEKLAGRKFSLEREFYNWNDVFPNEYDYASRDEGRTLVLSWNAAYSDGSGQAKWADIVAGNYDSDIIDRANRIKQFGATIYFAFHHEPDNGDANPNNPHNFGTQADFRDAWRHIHDIFEQQGVTNVKWTWILMAWTFKQNKPDNKPDSYYPGDSYVDVIAADGYNWHGCVGESGPWLDVPQIFTAWHTFGANHGKPMLVAEWGVGEDQSDPARKAQFISSGLTHFQNWPDIIGVSWFNTAPNPTCARWYDTSRASLTAFKDLGAASYFDQWPMVTLDSGPAEHTTSTSASFTFHSSQLSTTFTCQLDGGVPVPCAGEASYIGLAEGQHVLTIVPTSSAGDEGSPYRRTWSVDPVVASITSGPPARNASTTATFEFTGSAQSGDVTFRCQLDGGSPSSCQSPKVYQGLGKGAHTFTLTATDASSNTSTPVSWTWTVANAKAQVTVSDDSYTPSSLSGGPGPHRFVFSASNQQQHTVTDTSGLNLFDSGPLGAGSVFTADLHGALTYHYADTLHPAMTGTIAVPVVAVPASGSTTSMYKVYFADASPPAGFTYEVFVKTPGATSWTVMRWANTVGAARYTPKAGPGTYEFRSRLVSSVTPGTDPDYTGFAGGLASDWSPTDSITVS